MLCTADCTSHATVQQRVRNWLRDRRTYIFKSFLYLSHLSLLFYIHNWAVLWVYRPNSCMCIFAVYCPYAAFSPGRCRPVWSHPSRHHMPLGKSNLTQIFPSRGELGPRSNTMLLGTTRVSLPNGMSFRPTALARCTSVTDDIHTDGHNTLRWIVAIGFPWCRLIILQYPLFSKEFY